MNKAVFFDRDGIVNRRIIGGYVKAIEEFEINEDFLALFKYVKDNDYLAILVTNQQGIGKGLMSEADLALVHEYMQNLLEESTGSKFDAIYYCPDLAAANSYRRKPNPGMFEEAINQFEIDPTESWTIGDSPTDVIAGKRAGTNTILINNNTASIPFEADKVFADLEAALDYVRTVI